MASDRLSLIVAILSLGGGIFASAIAWWQAVRVTRMTNAVSERIERMKLDAERRRHVFEVMRNDTAPIETALGKLWTDLQIIRDVIGDILVCPAEDVAELSRNLADVAGSFAGTYAGFGHVLPKEAQRAAHAAKTVSIAARDFMRWSPVTTENNSTELNELRVRLAADRATLGQLQATVQLERSRLLERVLSVLVDT